MQQEKCTVYDMYYWDQPGQEALNGAKRPSRPVRGIRHPRRPASGAAGPAARALQVALDRRDNGGDSAGPGSQ
ncbi:MAG TPA: hypothetical protein VLW44_23005 [Streptosporangiaceae bacterium]|nr:hypothetical protein [Streptosporangiaceae bacterium]